jgi:murein DD-endopeptidase MepM/ murein hydrolase activator NlpD
MATLYWPFPIATVSEWPASAGRPNHTGTDFAIPQGTPLRATIDGKIVRHNNDGLGAYVLDIIADDGLLVRNGHLSRMDVQTGQRVTAGQVIGLTGGQPGTPGAGYSTGAHLHWELRRDRRWSGGAWLDPRKMKPQPINFSQKPTPKKSKGNKQMLMIKKPVSEGAYKWRYAVMATNYWLEFVSETTARAFETQVGGASVQVDEAFWQHCKRAAQPVAAGSTSEANLAAAVNDEMARRLQG